MDRERIIELLQIAYALGADTPERERGTAQELSTLRGKVAGYVRNLTDDARADTLFIMGDFWQRHAARPHEWMERR